MNRAPIIHKPAHISEGFDMYSVDWDSAPREKLQYTPTQLCQLFYSAEKFGSAEIEVSWNIVVFLADN